MLPSALRDKIRAMGVSDAIEMLVRDMKMPPQAALREIMTILEQDGESLPVHVLEEGDWEYAAPDEGVCTFSPT